MHVWLLVFFLGRSFGARFIRLFFKEDNKSSLKLPTLQVVAFLQATANDFDEADIEGGRSLLCMENFDLDDINDKNTHKQR